MLRLTYLSYEIVSMKSDVIINVSICYRLFGNKYPDDANSEPLKCLLDIW